MSIRSTLPADRQQAFFVPRQLMLVIEHAGALDRKHLGILIKRSNEAFDDADITAPRRVLTFPRPDGTGATSLVFADVRHVGDDPADLLRLLERLESYLGQSSGGMTLRDASPNWLSSRAPHFITGGPGAKPIPAPALDPAEQQATAGAPDTPYAFRMPALAQLNGRPGPIEVAILDTAPAPHDLAAAYNRWQAEHPVIRSLLGPKRPLRVTYSEYDDLVRLTSYDRSDGRHAMADHGLFVAGIVHSIAPYAALHLIEVLNPSGVGDIESVALGLQRVLKRRSSRPVIVNCSFVINVPTPDELDVLIGDDPAWRWLTPERVGRMTASLQSAFDAVYAGTVPIVAAAGNDGDGGAVRPPARFPAAFGSVLGVGALDENNQPTLYSNLADTPVEAGISTFGGAAHQGKAVAEAGVLGVYIGDFPDGTPNTTGWAWWAGTSFAAPIISGSLAALMSRGASFDSALARLRSAESGVTSEHEEIVSVLQQ